MPVNLSILIDRLGAFSKKSLEAASALCVNRQHYEVTPLHLLVTMLDEPHADAQVILNKMGVEVDPWLRALQDDLENMKSGNPGKPTFAGSLLRVLEDAWTVASLELGHGKIRSGAIFLAMLENPIRYGMDQLPQVHTISPDTIAKGFEKMTAVSIEISEVLDSRAPGGGQKAAAGGSALEKYTTNFTRRAREGKIDPVLGREMEIRQIVDVLARRRKNNPIAVGEPGVGKTAVVEGLALKIADKDVPEILQDVDVIGLDLGLLQAGASVKGEFENRLNGVITEIKESETPLILFIDEAHTLIGAGGAAGTGDAANLLKPALARGELRTIAATTWTEYKKYFEKDPALARRFQLIKLDEPSPDNTAMILRGVRDVYEKAHNVYIRDDALIAAAHLSARYITGRLLPDKAVDVLDTACARVKISLTSKPDIIEDLEKQLLSTERELKALCRDIDSGRSSDVARKEDLQAGESEMQDKLKDAISNWEKEKDAVQKVIDLRHKLHDVESDKGETPKAEVEKQLSEAIQALESLQGKKGYIAYEVTREVIGRVISDWTGIPLGNILRNEADNLSTFDTDMKAWVKGQDHAIDLLNTSIKAAKAGLQNPDQPLGVFLFVGPSGVGKTETALGLANNLFGGEKFITTINMSEFQEKHTVSKLVGSPAGYVGYGEGGLLTEAVRQRPYSVVLLDEVEKADLDVMNLFYQVFDKGMLSDGEGRNIDFKNTIVLLTSNLASELIVDHCTGDKMPTVDELTDLIRPALQAHFKPALLARMTIVPFFPLQGEVLDKIIELKLAKVAKRVQESQQIKFAHDASVVEHIRSLCTDVHSGARTIDTTINKRLMPELSNIILNNLDKGVEEIGVKSVNNQFDFTIGFRDSAVQ